MKRIDTALPGVLLIETTIYSDDRGVFFESYNSKRFQSLGLPGHFVQDNQSNSRQGVLRGLHYQLPQPQGKLVRVVSGKIYDVAVDLQKSSDTFSSWIGICLSGDSNLQLWIPPGFAHGFYVLSDWAEVIYKVTEFYNPETEQTLSWDDPSVGIEWPLINNQPPILSKKDAAGQQLSSLTLFD
jgi:dTDP-4-dehydrorhamnose 3,5-epimerase